jgi:hypothetical protein
MRIKRSFLLSQTYLLPLIYKKYGKEVINVIKKIYPPYGLKYTAKSINLDEKIVQNIVSTLGLKFKLKCKKIHRKIHPSVIDYSNPIFIYFLGFFWGDGSLSDNKKCNIVINNISQDLYNLLPFFYEICEWGFFEKKQKNRQEQLTLYINDRDLYNLLATNNYLNKKGESACKILNNIPKHLQFYWFRGFFDADGSYTFEDDCYGNIKKSFFSFTSSYNQNWDFIKILFKELNITNYTIYKHINKKQEKFSAIRISETKELKKILDYIYQGNTTMCLGRKYINYLKLCETLDYRNNYPYFKNNI